MKLSFNNQMRMEQRMKLAPRMIQSMEVLQLPLLALQEKIEAELNSNPVLELADEPPTSPEDVPTKPEENPDDRELVVREDSDRVEDFQRLENVADEFEDYFEGYSYRAARNDGEPDKKMEAMQNTAAGEISLHDSLREQWRLVETSDLVKAAGDLIIDYIDEKGYLSVRLEQLHNKDKYPFGLDELNTALRLIQKLEPAGVGARDLRECLLLQMEQFPEDMSFEMELVGRHWNDLLENHLPQIAKKMNTTVERIAKAIERMSKFDSSPGLVVGRSENHPITADVIIEPDGQGGYQVYLAETRMPSLRVNQFYRKMVKDRGVDENTRQFLQKNILSAQWFMDAIEQRKQTLLRVARAVVDYQKEFFDKGKLFLKPLPMATIAAQVGVHIATISRAVSGKYVQSPQGILPLRSFFSGGTEDDQGREMSYDAVKAKLEEIVAAEDKANPLSDDDLRKKLTEAGMGHIARRTVAKYRSILNIPTARFRKKY
ncbi:MAG: RNA polymerase factor sigma-54 [Planctomycetes bacterium]|nr:RNA polymerase factor sigma-54 [Planctomycetota bacterium]